MVISCLANRLMIDNDSAIGSRVRIRWWRFFTCMIYIQYIPSELSCLVGLCSLVSSTVLFVMWWLLPNCLHNSGDPVHVVVSMFEGRVRPNMNEFDVRVIPTRSLQNSAMGFHFSGCPGRGGDKCAVRNWCHTLSRSNPLVEVF
jgi:hypothetical protein